jgi:hypothetical protein
MLLWVITIEKGEMINDPREVRIHTAQVRRLDKATKTASGVGIDDKTGQQYLNRNASMCPY